MGKRVSFGLMRPKLKCYICWKLSTAHNPAKHHLHSEAWGDSIVLWVCCLSARTGKLVRVEGKMDGSILKEILNWGRASPYNRAITVSILPKLHWSGTVFVT